MGKMAGNVVPMLNADLLVLTGGRVLINLGHMWLIVPDRV
jgi:hypothetical protein